MYKKALTAILILFITVLISSSSFGVDTTKIDRVLGKTVLDNGDLRVIDDFIREGVRDIFRSRDFTDVSEARLAILDKKSTQGQYADQFSKSAYKHIKAGLEEVNTLQEEDRRFLITVNLLVLIDGLEDPALIELAIDKVKSDNKAIQYWAVHCITNLNMLKKLSSNADSVRNVNKILDEISTVVDGTCTEVLSLVAQFSANVQGRRGKTLFLKIVDKRIKEYENWTVKDELFDGEVLKLLYNKIQPSGITDTDIARRFAQLYSYVFQKYVLIMEGGNSPGGPATTQLASVLAEIEKACISKILIPQQTIRAMVARGDYFRLMSEHDRILGSADAKGELLKKLEFDYCERSTGDKCNEPKQLPLRPMKKTELR
jgi:hypothetical protein